MEIRTRLVNYMKELGDKDLCVAFSGGVDSSVILRAACEAAAANGKKVYAVTFETKLHPKADLPQAQKVPKKQALFIMLSMSMSWIMRRCSTIL